MPLVFLWITPTHSQITDFYDGEGRVLGEYDGKGSAIQETVYLDNMPVVVFKQEQGNTVPYYIYADHINTPRVITRASDNAMVWR